MKIKSWVTLAVVVVLTAAVSFLALNGWTYDKYKLKTIAEAVNFGLDLRGGISTEYVAKDASEENFDALMDRAVEVLRARLFSAGFTEATVARQGADRIHMEIPDVSNPENVISIIGSPAHLEFRDPDGEVILTGEDFASVQVQLNSTSTACVVGFKLTSGGTAKFAEATASLIGSAISIYLDDDLVSSPTVSSVITDGEGSIPVDSSTYDESYATATNLVILLTGGELPLEIEESETRAISAPLGDRAVNGAAIAGIVSLLAVIAFMIVMYRLPGAVSALSLIIYLLLVFYVLAILPGIKVTLPGIAGILLGVGMALDANIIIFERFREELQAGRTYKNALKFGYKNALSTIMDANVMTLIVTGVLLYFGTGAVQSFAATLLIGVIASLFTAFIIMRLLLGTVLRLGFDNRALYTR